MEKQSLLIIDDEEEFCSLMQEHLEAISDLDVFVALNGKEGIALAKKIRPSIIVLDVLMPDMDGLDVLEKLKSDKDTVEIPVIMLSARSDDEVKIEGAQLFDELYLTKPIEAKQLKIKIEEVLKRRTGA